MTDEEYLKESVVRGLVEILVAERGMNIPKALETVRKSRTFDLLMDGETCLYRESPSYVYELMREESGFPAE